MSRRVVVAIVAVAAFATLASCGKRSDSENFGREVVYASSMPRDIVDKFNAFVPDVRKPGSNVLDALADRTESWPLPSSVKVGPAGSPYVVALRVRGRVTGDDGAVTLWLVGFEPADGSGPMLLRPVAGLNAPKGGAKGDGVFERAAGSAPVSYRDPAEIRPVVQLQRRTGLVIESVDAEVWSGFPKPTWIEMLFGWQGALVGLAMLVFWWFAFRRRD